MKQFNSRPEKIQILKDLQEGKITIEQVKKLATGKRVVLRTFYDHMRFFYCVDENGHDVDRSAEIEAGLIEIEMPDTPFNRLLESK
jgi:sRNA-binding protein